MMSMFTHAIRIDPSMPPDRSSLIRIGSGPIAENVAVCTCQTSRDAS
jgi:hypothetical protein